MISMTSRSTSAISAHNGSKPRAAGTTGIHCMREPSSDEKPAQARWVGLRQFALLVLVAFSTEAGDRRSPAPTTDYSITVWDIADGLLPFSVRAMGCSRKRSQAGSTSAPTPSIRISAASTTSSRPTPVPGPSRRPCASGSAEHSSRPAADFALMITATPTLSPGKDRGSRG
jgi:hypothetical protein